MGIGRRSESSEEERSGGGEARQDESAVAGKKRAGARCGGDAMRKREEMKKEKGLKVSHVSLTQSRSPLALLHRFLLARVRPLVCVWV